MLKRIRQFRGGWIWATAAVVAAVLWATPDAMAQGRRMGGRMNVDMGQANQLITSRVVDQWIEMLSLTPDQKTAVEALHDAYREEHQRETRALRELVENAQQEFMETQDTGVFKDMADEASKRGDRISGIEKQFLDDFKSLLDPAQAEKWPKVERHHRRTRSLPHGMLAGESVNLLTIVNDLGLGSQSQELADALEQYEIDLDRALDARDNERKAVEERGREMMKDFDPAKMDFGKIRQMMTETRRAGIKVRDVNERYARRLSALVPDEQRADFEQRVRKASYPMVYREPYAMKALDAAKGFDDLTDDQRTAIEEIRASYARDLDAANQRWAAGIAEEERDGGGDPFMGFGRFVPGGEDQPESPAEEPKKQRRELDKAALDRLKALLTDEQKDRLPKREAENPWMAQFGGGGGEDADEEARPARRRGRN